MEPRRDVEVAGRPAAAGLVSRTTPLPDVSLSALYRTTYRPSAVWTAPGEPAVVGSGAAATLHADGDSDDRFAAVREQADTLFSNLDRSADAPDAARPRLLGGFAFHDRHERTAPWEQFAGAAFVLPEIQFTRTLDGVYLTVNAYGEDADPDAVEARLREVEATLDLDAARDRAASPADSPGVRETRRTTSKELWREQVEAALARIADGDLEKVVLAQSLAADLDAPFPLAATLDRLAATYPDCHRFAMRPEGDATFFGASPERLVSRQGSRIETCALASTIRRGDDPKEDEYLANELQNDEKYVREHELVAESIREQLAPVAENVVTGNRNVRKLDQVQHLYTPIAADVADDEHVLDVVEALHPTPAVGGLPPERALQTIRETETFDRGWYAAPVGWFDAHGDGTFAVAIRSAVARDDHATLFAGNGIVADSDPDREWEEIQLKFRPMLDHLQ